MFNKFHTMVGDLFSKLQEARQKIEDAKKKLNDVIVESESVGGEISIKANANKTITSIHISEDFRQAASAGELEDLLMKTVNKALDEAARMGEIEMKQITRDVLPNFPGLV